MRLLRRLRAPRNDTFTGRCGVKKRIKINGIIIGIAALAVVLFPKLFLRFSSGSIQEKVCVFFGFVFILLGQIIRVSARGYKEIRL